MLWLMQGNWIGYSRSKEHDSQLCRGDLFAVHDPVVHVVVEFTIAHLEVQVFEGSRIVHQVQTVVDVEPLFLCQDQRILDQFYVGHRAREIIERVAGLGN